MFRYLAAPLVLLTASCAALAAPASDVLVGKPAPAFSLPGDDGKPVDLVSFRGKRVVLAFFPKAFTSG